MAIEIIGLKDDKILGSNHVAYDDTYNVKQVLDGLAISYDFDKTDGYFQIGKFLVCFGEVTITPKANTATSKAVVFKKSFSNVCSVVITPISAVPGTQVLGVAAANITNTGFDAYLTRTNTNTTGSKWLAIGESS